MYEKKLNLDELCEAIDIIIAGKGDKIDLKPIMFRLNLSLLNSLSFDDVTTISEQILRISKTKNRKIRHLEKYLWRFINRIPFEYVLNEELDNSDGEELLPNTDYDNPRKKVLSRLTGLAQEVLELKDDKSKASDIRRAGSINIITDLIGKYHIPIARSIFLNSINSKNKKEQYSAIEGLRLYLNVTNDEVDEDLEKVLYTIKNKTDDRSVAVTCLQILTDAGIIDELGALFEIDEWKERNYY